MYKRQSIHESIKSSFPTVSHIEASSIETALDRYVIFDVREREEYAVSAIRGAIQIDPDISQSEFKTLYGDMIKDKNVLVYCSVGFRSSHLASRLGKNADDLGLKSIQNLEGGLFGWHNENRPVYNQDQETDLIHPYDAQWGQLVQREALRSYSPSQ